MDINNQEAIDLDTMLNHMAAEADNVMYDVDEFKRNVFTDYEDWQIEHLLKLLLLYHPSVIRLTDSIYYMIEPYGRIFITQRGGFTALYKKLHEEHTHKSEISNLEIEQLKLNVEDLRKKLFDYDKVEGRVKRNELIQWITIALSLIAIAISILSRKSG